MKKKERSRVQVDRSAHVEGASVSRERESLADKYATDTKLEINGRGASRLLAPPTGLSLG